MKLLIVGADSAIGVEFIKLLQQRAVDFVAPNASDLDPRDPLKVARVLTKCAPDQVVNLASYQAGSQFAIHGAELDPEACELVNHEQPSVLAQIGRASCRERV